ncbi:DUF1697 domain-containing protein [Paraglaciecola sp. L3A3]|uniref:DUF1697 domain-containing protein n=1 Tax=Paraglaciecola sp. L3A3 TaxID=2686358 RepID=UPI00131DE0CF|nr:DUF1697 domain-containing protein [Paraglaciecola sp. L3A3]
MNTWLVLFRAINVGGNNIIPMQALKESLIKIGCSQIQSYIQSGNLLVQHAENNLQVLSQQMVEQVKQDFNCSPKILLLDQQTFKQAVQNNPFPEAELKTIHWFFLSEPTKNADLSILQAVKKDSESYLLTDNVFYLHAPEGIGRSKLVTKVEKSLGVTCTARNGNTVHKLLSWFE